MKHLQVAAISAVLVLNAGMAMRSAVIAGESDDPSRFTYARLSCTADGETHFQNVTVEFSKNRIAPPAAPIVKKESEEAPERMSSFRETR